MAPTKTDHKTSAAVEKSCCYCVSHASGTAPLAPRPSAVSRAIPRRGGRSHGDTSLQWLYRFARSRFRPRPCFTFGRARSWNLPEAARPHRPSSPASLKFLDHRSPMSRLMMSQQVSREALHRGRLGLAARLRKAVVGQRSSLRTEAPGGGSSRARRSNRNKPTSRTK